MDKTTYDNIILEQQIHQKSINELEQQIHDECLKLFCEYLDNVPVEYCGRILTSDRFLEYYTHDLYYDKKIIGAFEYIGHQLRIPTYVITIPFSLLWSDENHRRDFYDHEKQKNEKEKETMLRLHDSYREGECIIDLC